MEKLRNYLSSLFLNSDWDSTFLVVTEEDCVQFGKKVKKLIVSEPAYKENTEFIRKRIKTQKDEHEKTMYFAPVKSFLNSIGVCCVSYLIFDRPSEYNEYNFIDVYSSYIPRLATGGKVVFIDTKEGNDKMKEKYPQLEQYVEFVEL